ncbi:hypothetical protein EW026_g3024 [Hermanssonia centrifuga]|uniref:Uncharacterized protein n=1 Tax=Hermanssonia centrifuga TaxID=98765 RepID=A0A4S4KNC8_9APHY|nr:hypothetical protein EW026_g3024 [Hermanssonia centrifuga]
MHSKIIASSLLLVASLNGAAAVPLRSSAESYGKRDDLGDLLSGLEQIGESIISALPSDVADPVEGLLSEVLGATAAVSDDSLATADIDPLATAIATFDPLATDSISVDPLATDTAVGDTFTASSTVDPLAVATIYVYESSADDTLLSVNLASATVADALPTAPPTRRGLLDGILDGNGAGIASVADGLLSALPSELAAPAASVLNKFLDGTSSAQPKPSGTSNPSDNSGSAPAGNSSGSSSASTSSSTASATHNAALGSHVGFPQISFAGIATVVCSMFFGSFIAL